MKLTARMTNPITDGPMTVHGTLIESEIVDIEAFDENDESVDLNDFQMREAYELLWEEAAVNYERWNERDL